MDLNKFLPELSRLETDGATVLLKWDGERESLKRTLVIEKPGTDYLFRRETDDLEKAIMEGISDYDEHFPNRI